MDQLDIFSFARSNPAFDGVPDEIVSGLLREEGVNEETIEQVLDYARSNPEIWHWFQKITFFVIGRGKKIGSKGVWEKIRWEVEIENDGEFKTNNNFPSYYGRVFELKYPEHIGFFQKRLVRGLKEAA